MIVDPSEATKWWHSPEAFQALWGIISLLSAVIVWFFKRWSSDRKLLFELKDKLDAMENGTSLAEMRARLTDIHEWWMSHIKKKV